MKVSYPPGVLKTGVFFTVFTNISILLKWHFALNVESFTNINGTGFCAFILNLLNHRNHEKERKRIPGLSTISPGPGHLQQGKRNRS